MDISEKAAYLKGLFDGMEFDMNDKQNKILKSLIDLVNEMAEEVSQLNQSYDDVCDQIDALDEDLSYVEDMLSEDDDYEEYYEDGEGCNCDYCMGTGDMTYEVTCPTCGATIALDESAVDAGSMKCPKCDELLEFDYDDEEQSDDDSTNEE